MFAKSTLFFALFAISTQLVASDTPPACFIAAINTQPNPADLDTICGSGSSDVQDQIRKLCGGDTNTALSAFSDNCKADGLTITISSSSSSSSGSASSTTSGSSSSGTNTSTASGTSSGSTSASNTSSTSASATATSSGSSPASGFSTVTSGSVVSTYPTGNSTSPSATLGSGSGAGSSGASLTPSQATSTAAAIKQNVAPLVFWNAMCFGAFIVFGMIPL